MTDTPASFLSRPVLRGRVRTKDLVLFARQVATMIDAGVPIIQNLQAILKQINKPLFRQVLQDTISDIRGGESLSQALVKHPKIFPPFFLGLVRTGEASGRLGEALSSLSEYLEREHVFQRKIIGALVYPAMILGVMVVVTIILFAFVLPQLSQLFAESNVVLPLPTRIVLGAVNFTNNYWYYVLAFAIVIFLIARSYFRTSEGRFMASTIVLKLPFIQGLFQKVYLSRLTAMLHILLKSDVPLLESLNLAEGAVSNKVYRKILRDTAEAVKDGSLISAIWELEPFIPPLLSTIVNVGERSGKISQAFGEANHFFQREVEELLNTINTLFEPLMVILLGIGVAIVVSAVFLPIYNLVLTF